MQGTRMTRAMMRSLEERLKILDRRIGRFAAQRPEEDENGDAMALLAYLSSERAEILEALRGAVLIDDAPFDNNAVEIGDRVTVREAGGDSREYLLVEGSSSRVSSDWVSASAPLGAALLGKAVGDEIVVSTPGGTSSYVILAFERASDSANHEPRPWGTKTDAPVA
ncbi:MAG TPA: GreA/GreB family elongation factor [Actinomycetota bacterium]|nr:GreA/GreB family elongation factor [Actinomycetota bacterium]